MPWYFSNPHGRTRSLSARELCCLGEVISAHQWKHQRKRLEGQQFEKLVKTLLPFQNPSLGGHTPPHCDNTHHSRGSWTTTQCNMVKCWLCRQIRRQILLSLIHFFFFFWIYQELAWAFACVLRLMMSCEPHKATDPCKIVYKEKTIPISLRYSCVYVPASLLSQVSCSTLC